jgi:hypothetical protein
MLGLAVASLLILIFPFVKAPVGLAAVMLVALLIARRWRSTLPSARHASPYNLPTR